MRTAFPGPGLAGLAASTRRPRPPSGFSASRGSTRHRWMPPCHQLTCGPSPPQYIDAISSKQGELESYVSDGYRTALTEERRRLCFLVEKQCAVAKSSAAYHAKVRPRPRRDGCPAARSLRAFQLPRGAFWKEHDRVRLQTCLDSH